MQHEIPLYHQIMKLLAFTARYGHQDMTQLKHLPITELMSLSSELGVLLREEADAVKRTTDT